jgi:hypothetical protein
MRNYRVTAACVVHVPIATQAGHALGTLYRDAVFTGDPDSEKVRHLLASDMIEEIGGDGQPVVTEPDDPAADSGSQPPQVVTSRSNKADLVAYGVAQGDDRAELEALNREQLLDKYVRS